MSTPARAVGISTRPVPHPTSSTGLPAAVAASTKNATSGLSRYNVTWS